MVKIGVVMIGCGYDKGMIMMIVVKMGIFIMIYRDNNYLGEWYKSGAIIL